MINSNLTSSTFPAVICDNTVQCLSFEVKVTLRFVNKTRTVKLMRANWHCVCYVCNDNEDNWQYCYRFPISILHKLNSNSAFEFLLFPSVWILKHGRDFIFNSCQYKPGNRETLRGRLWNSKTSLQVQSIIKVIARRLSIGDAGGAARFRD